MCTYLEAFWCAVSWLPLSQCFQQSCPSSTYSQKYPWCHFFQLYCKGGTFKDDGAECHCKLDSFCLYFRRTNNNSPCGDLDDKAIFLMTASLHSFFDSFEYLWVRVTTEKIHLIWLKQKLNLDFAVYKEHNCLYIAIINSSNCFNIE